MTIEFDEKEEKGIETIVTNLFNTLSFAAAAA